MSETPQTQTTATEQEVLEVMTELEQYRQRIIDEAMEMAKKIKMPKKQVLAQLENNPEIAKINAALEGLKSQQGASESPQSSS